VDNKKDNKEKEEALSIVNNKKEESVAKVKKERKSGAAK
jgi:hypothetical protein